MQRGETTSEAGSEWLNVRGRSYKPRSHFSFNLREMERHKKDLRNDVTQVGLYFQNITLARGKVVLKF